MAKDIAIKVDNVSKAFMLPHEKQSSVKGMFINLFHGKRSYEKQQVLKNISFEIKKGEFFGIVGRNGSGKSTLLKMLAGIYEPDSGTITINGKLTPFIELGVGFNPELTGRENVFLNGALLGFSRKEMSAMYDEIVEFAELEKFMDQKLKNYSSGMQVRLAFSIAIRADTPILLIDEVLAVGDERFQNKCLDIFENMKKTDRTVVFVSHDMEAVKRFCDMAIVVHDGKLVYKGDSSQAAVEYIKINFPETITQQENLDNQKNGQKISTNLLNSHGKKAHVFTNGDKATLDVSWRDTKKVENVGVAIYSSQGHYIFGANTILDKVDIKNSKVSYDVELNLGSGRYYMQVGLFGKNDTEKISFIEKAEEFSVISQSTWQGTTYLKHSWENR